MTQRTLIVGGATGIGFAVAQLMATRGDHIILAGRHHDKLQHACRQLQATGAAAESVVADIADETQLARLGRALEPVDNIVVTASSQAPGGSFTTLDLQAAKQAFDTKFWGSLAVARHLSGNIRAGGTLTLTSGFLARRTVPGTLVKTAMNAGLEAAVKVLAKELSPLRVNAISPGLTDTEAYAGMPADAREQMLARAAENLPARRYGRAEDLAKGYLFVIDNPFVTGSVVDIDGGALIN
ncbi:SDR family oxidoreductase [Citrobacter sp. DNRA3]|uniref:SDR family oxidoreductase n=1 Tax=Citrobacter sp. DNRA3 TaxID=2723054 RepID=UPI00145926A6|nr:SDR family oxidoreductase [Citrobacter sp. DNRA3]NBJ29671.1 SDR family oxidoreductase [Citrobacter freundii]NMD76560.1 SDR family oxidoreductase [Citrobacter sp. DNRA3]